MPSNWLSTPEQIEPYSKLAPFYDHVMRHVNYAGWARYLRRLFAKADVQVKEVLDIACGTGSLMLRLKDLDFKVCGFDASESMVQVGRNKVGAGEPLIWCGLMTGYCLKKRFQAIVCTYDSLNYCLDPDAVRFALVTSGRALVRGGLFIFDVCTRRNSIRHFQNYYERDEISGHEYVRRSFFSREKSIQTNEFIIRKTSRPGVPYIEVHQQRIYGIAELAGMIPGDIFELVGVYDGFTMRKGTEQSDRVHFVLKRI